MSSSSVSLDNRDKRKGFCIMTLQGNELKFTLKEKNS